MAVPSNISSQGVWVLASWFLHGVITVFGADSQALPPVSFNQQVRPLLAEHCLHCHGPDASQRKGDLRLDVGAAARSSAIVAGNPQASPLMERLLSQDPDQIMPPPEEGDRLPQEAIELFARWIEQGAEYDEHWAFQPLHRADPPEVENAEFGTLTDMDRFILARLEDEGLGFSPPASSAHWLRRVSFDLTGLPPSPQGLASFLEDDSPAARAKIVDDLLASRQYGEHWGRHWLDIARYADTHGGSAIGFTRFPFSYTYRDYVVDAFQKDLPYDRFIMEQLAADSLNLTDQDPALAALGFLTVGQRFRTRHDTLDDQIDVITRGLMGLTVSCARCHDHKFDPIPTTDYYQLYAALDDSEEPDLLPMIGEPAQTDALAAYQQSLEHLTSQLGDVSREQGEVLRSRLRMQVGAYLHALAQGTPEQDLSVSFLSFRTDDLRPHVLERWRTYLSELSENDPVFGPWKILNQADERPWPERLEAQLAIWKEANGDPASWGARQELGSKTPAWNPIVLEALETQRPDSLEALARVYGDVFSQAHQQWIHASLEAAREALPGALIVPDQDPRHATINGAIDRQLRHHLYAPGTPTALEEDLASRLLNRTVSDHLGGRRGAIHDLHLNHEGSPPRAMVLEQKPDSETSTHHVFRRGNPLDRGQIVKPGFLTSMDHVAPGAFAKEPPRKALAQAIVSPQNPLTPRVVVNWVWKHHFGQALVRTPDDFGTRGAPPTHPELLDYLAQKLIEEGWSLKKLHRRLLLSRTYAQASVERSMARGQDPDNRLWWRMPRRRLSLESMRDAMLAASGELDLSAGGRPFDMMTEKEVPRRSVYGFVNRDVPSPLLTTFDGANPSACTARRPETTVPQQTLFALNSRFILDRAAAMARREALVAIEGNSGRIKKLYQWAYGRLPDQEEEAAADAFLKSGQEDSPEQALERLAHALLASNEFIFVD